ncbi:MAG: hypothetical protein J7K49_04985 [Thaumarchaeota archaeon]|nr:hypothetical protein [Nitrososphaerota archaeon]
MIVGIIIAIFLGLGLLLFSIQSLPSLASEAIQAIMEPFLLMVDKMFFFLATIVPILAAVIPLYILRNRDDRIIILGSLYGLALMFIVVAFGLSDQIVSYFQTAWATSWTATLGTLAHVLYAVFFWLWGATLYVLDVFLSGLIKLSSPAEWLQKKVRKQKQKWKSRRKKK